MTLTEVEMMDRLPTKRDEVETQAYALACDWVRHHGASPSRNPGERPWLGVSPLKPAFGTLVMRDTLRGYMMAGGRAQLEVIEMARAGWDQARAVVEDLISEHESRHNALPSELAAYSMALRAGLLPDWPQLTGPRREHRLFRDQFVALCAELLVDRFQLPATYREARPRGRPTTRRPASEITSNAWNHVLGKEQ